MYDLGQCFMFSEVAATQHVLVDLAAYSACLLGFRFGSYLHPPDGTRRTCMHAKLAIREHVPSWDDVSMLLTGSVVLPPIVYNQRYSHVLRSITA